MHVGDQEGLLRELPSQMANLQRDVEELKLSRQPQDMDVEVEDEVEKDDDAEEPPTWGMLLQPPQVVPKVAEAVSLSLLLARPPFEKSRGKHNTVLKHTNHSATQSKQD